MTACIFKPNELFIRYNVLNIGTKAFIGKTESSFNLYGRGEKFIVFSYKNVESMQQLPPQKGVLDQ